MNLPLPRIIALLSVLLLTTYSHAQITVTAQASKDTICRGEQVVLSANVNATNTLPCGTTQFGCGNNPMLIDSIAPETLLQQGSDTIQNTVYANYRFSYRMQFLYKAEEIAAILGGPGLISSLGWQIGALNSTGSQWDFTIKVACIPPTQDTLSTWETNLTTVYSTSFYHPVVNWNIHNLYTPYYWDGISNLLIDVSHYNLSTQNKFANFMVYSNLPSTVLFASSTGNITNNNNVIPIVWHERPNLRLRVCAPTLPSVTYYWYANDTLISNNAQTLNVSPSVTTIYKAMAIYNNDTVWSNPINITVNQPIPTSFSPSTDTVVCSNTVNIMLAANNVYANYHWSNGATTPTINVTNIGNYSLTATDTLGCTTTAGPINVSKYASPTYTIQSGNYCQALPQVIFPSGDIAYTWSNGDTGRILKVRHDDIYSVTASYANCSDTFNIGFLATSDTMEHTYFDLNINTDMGFYDFVVHPTNYPNYIIHTTQDTTFGPFNAQPITIGFYSLPCNIYYNHYIRIVTTNNVCIDTTDWQFMPVCFLNSITELEANRITLYPNPANDYIEVALSNGVVEEVLIIDALGRIYTTDNTAWVDVRKLAAGVYTVAVKTQQGHSRASFIKY